MRISVICTVLNEAAAVGRLLDGLLAQTRPPDEVVIVDGGSSDGTPAVVLSYADRLPLKLQEARGANISRGRNLAVKRSSGDVIASTDAGVRLPPDWLERLTAPFTNVPPEDLRDGSLRGGRLLSTRPAERLRAVAGRDDPAVAGRHQS